MRAAPAQPRNNARRRGRRLLAIAALLALLGGQWLEAQHNHAHGEFLADCVFCQGAGDKPAVACATGTALPAPAAACSVTTYTGIYPSPQYHRLARGPPQTA